MSPTAAGSWCRSARSLARNWSSRSVGFGVSHIAAPLSPARPESSGLSCALRAVPADSRSRSRPCCSRQCRNAAFPPDTPWHSAAVCAGARCDSPCSARVGGRKALARLTPRSIRRPSCGLQAGCAGPGGCPDFFFVPPFFVLALLLPQRPCVGASRHGEHPRRGAAGGRDFVRPRG